MPPTCQNGPEGSRMSLSHLIDGLLGRVAPMRVVARYPHGMFGPVRVLDTHDVDGLPVRILEVDGSWQSATYLDDGWCELAFPYHRLYDDVLVAAHATGNVLMLGGGACAYPKYAIAHHPEATVDVVEVDPLMLELARRHFFLDRLEERYHAQAKGRLRLHQADALDFLRTTDQRYDAILNDCFQAEEPLASLSSPEALDLVRTRLLPHGLYLINVVSALEGPGSAPLAGLLPLLGERFKMVLVLPCGADEAALPDNNVVVATDAAPELDGALDASALGL